MDAAFVGLHSQLSLQRGKLRVAETAQAQLLASPALMIVEGFPAPLHGAQGSNAGRRDAVFLRQVLQQRLWHDRKTIERASAGT